MDWNNPYIHAVTLIVAITVADVYYQIRLPIGLCYLAVGASIIANLVSIYVYPATKRLSENEALLTLMFDLSQLSLLVFLTGGLANPFALLILAPVTISATALELRTTVILGGFLGAAFITLLPIALNLLLPVVAGLVGIQISTAGIAHAELMIFGALIVWFLIVEPHGLAKLWAVGKQKLRLWPFPH